MLLVCPECKNQIDLVSYPDLEVGHVVECEMCGITLEVNNMDDDQVRVAIVDEGK
ncbi:MAG: lysine biosynthesis protein LysW [Candidatus Magasanikbacteria bacterium]|nr:lysine biosynthesis protein LysW [Candidatus Magasanikbacteria bacterium]